MGRRVVKLQQASSIETLLSKLITSSLKAVFQNAQTNRLEKMDSKCQIFKSREYGWLQIRVIAHGFTSCNPSGGRMYSLFLATLSILAQFRFVLTQISLTLTKFVEKNINVYSIKLVSLDPLWN